MQPLKKVRPSENNLDSDKGPPVELKPLANETPILNGYYVDG
jgi:hypothetical protein